MSHTLVNTAPEPEPVTNTRLGSMLYVVRAYRTADATPRESPPASWMRVSALPTSQQVPLLGAGGTEVLGQCNVAGSYGTKTLTLRVEDDEATLIGERCIFSVGVILACGSRAVMKSDEQGRRGCNYIRFIEVDQYVVGIRDNPLDRDEACCSRRDCTESEEQLC